MGEANFYYFTCLKGCIAFIFAMVSLKVCIPIFENQRSSFAT